jgi:hypothetical protein
MNEEGRIRRSDSESRKPVQDENIMRLPRSKNASQLESIYARKSRGEKVNDSRFSLRVNTTTNIEKERGKERETEIIKIGLLPGRFMFSTEGDLLHRFGCLVHFTRDVHPCHNFPFEFCSRQSCSMIVPLSHPHLVKFFEYRADK